MHNWSKSIMECVKSKVDAMGMDNLNREDVEELKIWACIAKDIAEYDYYYHITEAMEKPENKYGVNYDENGKYYTPMRDSDGRYMSRAYDGMYDRSPRYDKMYYEGEYSTRENNSRYDMARRGYEEAKMNHPTDDVTNMDKMKDIFEVLKGDMKELKPHMTSQEKTYARNELTNMANTLMWINGLEWEIKLVNSDSVLLMRPDGSRTVGMTDWNTRCVYLDKHLHGAFLEKVLCHELCHVFCFSYNIVMDSQQEEILAEWISTYGRDVIELLDSLLSQNSNKKILYS